MALIDLAEFKTTLGVGNLYADAQLQGVMDSAEAVVLNMLQQYNYSVDRICCTTANTIKMRTTTPHDLYVGQAVTLSGLVPGQYNGSAVVATLINDLELTVTKAHGQTPFSDEHPLIPPGRIADTAQAAIVAAWISGATIYLRWKPDGTNGFKVPVGVADVQLGQGVGDTAAVTFTFASRGKPVAV